VVSLGRNHPIKGYAQGIRALAKVLQSRRNVHYFLFGRGIENLAPLVSSLGLGDRVHLSGWVLPSQRPSTCLRAATRSERCAGKSERGAPRLRARCRGQ
jgi:glycosyltransferase involved in cell wall biosynthesis